MTAPAQASTAALELAASARAGQLAVRAAVMRDVAQLWPTLNVARLDATFPGWLRAMILVVGGYHAQSAALAGRYYRTARSHAIQSPTPARLIQTSQPPAEEWLRKAFGFSGPGMLSRDTLRPGTALSTTLGTAARVALDGGRSTVLETVKHDPVAVGWYRVTDGHPCGFCALMASRGIAYKSERSAEFKSHNDCGCDAAPAFHRDQPLPEINQQAAQVYRERGNGDALVAFRKAWAEHQSA